METWLLWQQQGSLDLLTIGNSFCFDRKLADKVDIDKITCNVEN